ncbi:orotidine-5'-phosphate decarboxylase [Gemmatimonas aurantiaca]|uniref:orotidine-5'-phosphate decarboxylase n=1 Tax=Gemmatimonas aurantiaca TaxID=173480 RepID=UPI00301BD118
MTSTDHAAARSAPSPSAVAAIPIVALDVPDRAGAEAVVRQLGDACDFYKVGLELFAAEGPAIVAWLRAQGKRVFVDLKLHDIPNTVRGAARSVARHGASLLTIHASGGAEMIAAAVAGANEGAPEGSCGILGVTVLTSMDATGLGAAWGRSDVDVQAEVLRLAGDVAEQGAAGIVCSGHEAAAVHARFGDRLGLLIPGIRLPGGDTHDQRRIMTPRAAADAGARWLILGRAVTAAADPVVAMEAVRQNLHISYQAPS